eukprot:GHRR01005016.1.p1 GENE.GHRR01005016.1~~GHRR01005016.1.p1  ORF type:complete len:819 (+),score=345.29 GHRR01005016.1:316-2772(+)
MATERQVGITEYTTSTTGFTGIIKHRYADFQVFEVDQSGHTAHLTSLDAPAPAQAGTQANWASASATDSAGNASAATLTGASLSETIAAFTDIAGQANAAQLEKLLSSIQQQGLHDQTGAQAADQPQQWVQEVKLLPVMDKETRKAIHQFLKSDPRLPPLQTDTITADKDGSAGTEATKNVIRVCVAGVDCNSRDGGQGRRGQKRKANEWRNGAEWEGGADKYVKFVMFKENMDTQAALGVISRMLHINTSSFGFAGTKDKRGVTTQFVTVWKTPPWKLAALNPRLRGIKLGNFAFAGSHLSLGHLRGNTFKIMMREVNTSDEQHIADAVSEVRQKGFINYFGLQRFGTGAVPTFRVGSVLLCGGWKTAVRLIMQGGPDERQEFQQARALYMDKEDIMGALKVLPNFLVAERAVLHALAKCGPNSHLQALQGIPRTLRSMYIHAWQSWLWNRIASERVKRYGADKVLAGDLVLLTPAAAQQQQQTDSPAKGSPAEGSERAEQAAAAAEQSGVDASDASVDEVAVGSLSSRLRSVHLVTADEVDSGRFSITDVVLPLPGSQVQYPQHAAGWELYCQLAAADGVRLPGITDQDFAAALQEAKKAAAADPAYNNVSARSAPASGAAASSSSDCAPASNSNAVQQQQQQPPVGHNVKEFDLAGLTGDYRKLLHVPTDLSHRVVRYQHPDQDDLLPTDWHELQASRTEHQKRQRMEQQGMSDPTADAPSQQQDPQGQPGDAAQNKNSTAAGSDDSTIQNGPGNAAPPPASAPEQTTGNAINRALVGVVLEFTLPASCYATMLIRELTKSSTSKASHKQLSMNR